MSGASQTPFRLKADMVALTVMHLQTVNLDEVAQQLQSTVSKAPRFFDQAPLVIDVRDINAKALNLSGLLDLFSAHDLIPAGIRGLNEQQEPSARELGLVCLQYRQTAEPHQGPAPQPSPPTPGPCAKIITTPVRAGTKVYAKDRDLVIIAPVNVGAECIADGNIHVYGPLRGRALAGASGNAEARIFCQQLEAELIAIAGHYQVRENLTLPTHTGGLLQVFLNNNKLAIESI